MPVWWPLAEFSHALSRWWRLPFTEKRVLVRISMLLPVVDWSLRRHGVRRTRRWLLRGIAKPRQAPEASAAIVRAQRWAVLTSIMARHLLRRGDTCLREALVLEHCLRRQGVDAHLRIGARRTGDGGLDAHAWVESGGVALGQAPPSYATFGGVDRQLR